MMKLEVIFLKLQNFLKNMNFTTFESEKYNEILGEVQTMLEQAHKEGAQV